MNVYEVNLREEVDACQRESIDPNSYLQTKSRLFAGLMSLQRFAPDKWTPQVLDPFKAQSPIQLKENLLSSLPLSKEESDSLDNSSLDSWYLSLCALIEEKTFVYLLYERACNSYSKHFAPRLRDIVALGIIGGGNILEVVDVTKILSEIIGRELSTEEEFTSSLDHPKVKAAIERVLQDKAVANGIDKTVEFLNQQTVEYFKSRLLDAVDTALWSLFNEASLYADTQMRAAKGLPPLRAWRNKQITHFASTLKRREAIARLEVIEQGKPKGVKKRPRSLIDGAFRGKTKAEFYDKLYDTIQRRSSEHLPITTKDVIAKCLTLRNGNQLDSILRYYKDGRTWKQIRDHAVKIENQP